MATHFANDVEWLAWAKRLGTAALYFKDDFKAAAGALSENTVKELGMFYDKVVRTNGVADLNAWLQSIDGPPPMSADERGIRNLVLLFPHIGRYWGFRPFNSNALAGGALIAPRPDWSKLPAGAEFLGEPATWAAKFTYVDSEAGQGAVRVSVTEPESVQLRSLAEKLRRLGFKELQKWYLRMGVTEHIEALLVSNLIGVLDSLSLRYYD